MNKSTGRRILLCAVFLGATALYVNPASAKDTSLDAQRQRFEDYFSRCAQLGYQYPPPGKNAASGHFRNAVVSDPTLMEIGNNSRDGKVIYGSSTTDEALAIAYAFSSFALFHSQGFSDFDNYESNWISNRKVFFDTVNGILPNIGVITLNLYNAINGNGNDDERKKALNTVVEEIGKLVSSIENDGIVSSGSHANGFIAERVDLAATSAIQELNTRMPESASSEAKNIAALLRATFIELKALPEDSHDPWLRADWQVSYTAIMDMAAKQLHTLKP